MAFEGLPTLADFRHSVCDNELTLS